MTSSTPKEMLSQEDSSQIIVQCPSCQTKFAVDSHTVSEFAFPRFHCSRCDHVFDIEQSRLLPRGQRGSVRQTMAEVQAGAAAGDMKVAANDGPTLNIERASFPGLSIPKTYDPSVSVTPPHEGTMDSQIQMNFNNAASAVPKGFTLGGPNRWDTISKEQQGDKVLETKKEQVSPVNSRHEQHWRYKGVASAWRGMMWLAGPVLVAITVCLFISYLVSAYPSLGRTFFSGAFSVAPRVPPAGLMIEKTEFQKVILESGDTVYTVAGSITNRTKQPAKDILVEAILFDAQGGVVARQIVSAGSSLARTRIKSLSEEMIQNLQTGTVASKRSDLKPGQSQDFLIALLNSEAARAQYYSARIFSVGPN